MKITKALADLERSKLSELQHCDDPISIDSLYSMIKVIRIINDYLVKASEGKTLKESNRFDEGALYESQIHLEVWLKRKNKKTLVETFKEYKRDILDDFDKCISFGDANNFWENMD